MPVIGADGAGRRGFPRASSNQEKGVWGRAEAT
jgi:hypothetical protein